MEIERKFLIKQEPSLRQVKNEKVIQGYISTDPVIRIRQMNKHFSLCMKSQGHMIREEFELELTEEQFEALWPKVEFNAVEKTRYFIPLNKALTAELDIYHGHLEGLMTVEVEFDSPSDASKFTPPEWFGTEITHDNRFKNNHLAMYGVPIAE